ncbi:protein FAM124A [Brienomyrus brachyistius]|uniref:protein FAM124A n=1 Tax=Brienomyrus brachyistius TaxID=42636 RepID=UPI0020B3BEBD|nr:protein FAM124A [Brienomyrus brachyistius]
MLRRTGRISSGTEDDNADSGAESAESDCSKMSSAGSDMLPEPDGGPPLMAMHILANPGDSLLLQHTLDRLLGWLSPSSRFFHVSERACPLRGPPSPVAGWPSLAVTLFLHESHGEQRILRVLDVLQRPPWQYHHTESCRGLGAAPGPYLLPSRDFYSLGPGMPVWAVRPVHCGSEALRVTLHCGHADFEDAVRFYEMVLRRRAEEPKPGFCWFSLRLRPGLQLQLALKQLALGVRPELCHSAVLQFQVDEIGQLVPLLPNPCTPISVTRWQTEDLDGNKILFQAKGHFHASGSTPIFRAPQHSASLPLLPARSTSSLDARLKEQGPGHATGGPGRNSCCSTPASSCYSSQRSSPTAPPGLLLEETDVDTGCSVAPPMGGVLDTFGRDLRVYLPPGKASSLSSPGVKSTGLHSGPTGTPPSLTVLGRESPAALGLACGHKPQEEEFFI